MVCVALIIFLLVTSVSVPSVFCQEVTGTNDETPPAETVEAETVEPQVTSDEGEDADAMESFDIRKILIQDFTKLLRKLTRELNATSPEEATKLLQALLWNHYDEEGNVVRSLSANDTGIADNLKVLDQHPGNTFIVSVQRSGTTHEPREEFCRVNYEEKCFWLEFDYGVGMTCRQARHICASNGGRLAYIYSPEHLKILQSYVKTLAVEKNELPYTAIFSWIGFRYSSESQIVYPDGSPAPYPIWQPVEQNQCVAVLTTMFWSDDSEGFYNRARTDTAESVICEVV